MIEYRVREGAKIDPEKVDKYGKELKRLAELHGGYDPETLVQEASRKKSPLHDYFDWNDSHAAHQHRLQQARILSRSIVQVEISRDRSEKTTHLLSNLNINRGKSDDVEKRYVVTQTAMNKKEYRIQLVEKGLRELESWSNRYGYLRELESVARLLALLAKNPSLAEEELRKAA